ncbi:MAG: PF20097 family protein [Oscillospiraceae bacterium]|nr:PF20097 family protein [Oscillospiraceae bacterium]
MKCPYCEPEMKAGVIFSKDMGRLFWYEGEIPAFWSIGATPLTDYRIGRARMPAFFCEKCHATVAPPNDFKP